MRTWTAEQKNVIEHTGGNLLVSAAAGSGKTAVLVERIAALITEKGASIEDMLVVTFTNAAASEMKSRISDRLAAAASVDTSEHIEEQLSAVNAAHIQTIHSFCTEVIRKYYYIVQLPPNFRILDEAEAVVMRRNALEELFAMCYEEDDADFLKLVEFFVRSDRDDPLADLISRLYAFTREQPDPERWFDSSISLYSESTAWLDEFTSSINERLSKALSHYDEAIELCSENGTPASDFEAVHKALVKNRDTIMQILSTGSMESRLPLWSSARSASIRANDSMNPEQFFRVKQLHGKGWKLFSECKAEALEIGGEQEQKRQLAALKPIVESLKAVLLRYDTMLSDKKITRGAIEMSDIQQYALKCVSDERVAEQYRELFKYIFIDEYQDSNLLQEAILTRISDGSNLFMVGDIKQSIYRFRLADPSLFVSRLNDPDDKKIFLSANFRSDGKVLDAINDVFSFLMTEQTSSIDYDRRQRLTAGSSFPDDGLRGAELLLIPETGEKMRRADEAQAIASKIAAIVGREDIYDVKTQSTRKCRYGDIAVLMRSVRDKTDEYINCFSSHGIPVSSDSGSSFFDSEEISVMLALLNILDNYYYDNALITVLRSPIGGFNEEELACVRIDSPDASFAEAFLEASRKDDSLGKKAAEFLQHLESWRFDSQIMQIHELLYKIYEETGYLSYVTGLPGGNSRYDNLMLLASRAGSYCTAESRGVSGFLRFVEFLKSADKDLDTAKAAAGGEDAVRIMTVHKSKGLEFPIVFYANIPASISLSAPASGVFLHQTKGISMDYFDPIKRYTLTNISKAIVGGSVRSEETAEEIRILYVALTRAINKLYVAVTAKSVDELINAALNIGEPSDILSARNSALWLCAPIIRSSLQQEICGVKLPIAHAPHWNIEAAENSFTVIEPDGSVQEPARDALLSPEQIDILNWKDKNRRSALPSKSSVTALSNDDRDVNANKEAMERGSAIHTVMRHIDFASVHSAGDVSALIADLHNRAILSEDEAGYIDAEKIYKFVSSPFGQSLATKDLYRETPFSFFWPPEADIENRTIVQGIIDCYYYNGDGSITLLDYKTDRFSCPAAEQAKKHSKQLAIYAAALETLLHKTVKNKIIVFLNYSSVEDKYEINIDL